MCLPASPRFVCVCVCVCVCVWFGAVSVTFVDLAVFVQILHYFDNCSFVVLSEAWEGYAYSFVLSSQDCFGST